VDFDGGFLGDEQNDFGPDQRAVSFRSTGTPGQSCYQAMGRLITAKRQPDGAFTAKGSGWEAERAELHLSEGRTKQ